MEKDKEFTKEVTNFLNSLTMDEYKFSISESKKITRKVGEDFLSNELHWTARGETDIEARDNLVKVRDLYPLSDPKAADTPHVAGDTPAPGETIPDTIEPGTYFCATCQAAMKYQEWTGKDGRAWKAFKCPNEIRGNKNIHKPQWVQ